MTDSNLLLLTVTPYAKAAYRLKVELNGHGSYVLVSENARYEKLTLGRYADFRYACGEAWKVKERDEQGRLD